MIAGLWLDKTAAYTFVQSSAIIWRTVDTGDHMWVQWNFQPGDQLETVT